jgi:hypothetical protein
MAYPPTKCWAFAWTTDRYPYICTIAACIRLSEITALIKMATSFCPMRLAITTQKQVIPVHVDLRVF